jgi:hypothetical protein
VDAYGVAVLAAASFFKATLSVGFAVRAAISFE